MAVQTNTRARAPAEPETIAEKSRNQFSASDARANFMEVIGRVRYGRERLVVTNKGKPAAALVTLDDLKLLELLDDSALRSVIDERIKELQEPGATVPWEEAKRRRKQG